MYEACLLKTKEKLDEYAALLRNLQMLYQDCKFEMIPIIVGALGYVSKDLKTNLEKLNFDEKEVKSITRKLQTISVSRTVKIMTNYGIQSVKSNLELMDVSYPL